MQQSGQVQADSGVSLLDANGTVTPESSVVLDTGVEESSAPACGDGVQQAPEECDEGPSPSTVCPPGVPLCRVCTSDCRLVPGAASACGDGKVDPGEQCDDGADSSVRCPYGVERCVVCDASCRLTNGVVSYCGDGVVSDDEQCDTGDRRGGACLYGDDSCTVCDIDCRIKPGVTARCGDGVVNGQESCDDGNSATERCDPSVPSCVVCTAACTWGPGSMSGVAVCGDGVVSGDEQCDEGGGNTEYCSRGASQCTVCSPACRRVAGKLRGRCGDGYREQHEQCDDGNVVTESCTYGMTSCTVCDASCRLVPGRVSLCGDGIVDPGEECDEGPTPATCPVGQGPCRVCNTSCRHVFVYGPAPALLTLSDGPTFDFGSVWHPAEARKTLVVTNTGGSPARLRGALSLAGLSLAAPLLFVPNESTCIEAGLIPAFASCTLVIGFAPSVDGAMSQTLRLAYDDGTSMPTEATRPLVGDGFGTSASCAGGAMTAVPFAGGTGTVGDPYVLCTPTQLGAIGGSQGRAGQYFRLGKSVNLDGVSITPVGSVGVPFQGSFDGNGYRIVGLSLTGTSSGVGLFSAVGAGASLGRIRVSLGSGGVAGGATLDDVGGLVGLATGAVTVSDCVVEGPGGVSGRDAVGGLLGRASAATTITGSYATVAVTGRNNVGGLVGNLSPAGASIASSYASGAVAGTGQNAGGLVGYLEGAVGPAYATGLVTGASGVGGLVGTVSGGTVANAYARGAVVANAGAGGGGAIGTCSGGSIQNVYSAGSVSGSSSNLVW